MTPRTRQSELTPLGDIVAQVFFDILRRCEEYANRQEST